VQFLKLNLYQPLTTTAELAGFFGCFVAFGDFTKAGIIPWLLVWRSKVRIKLKPLMLQPREGVLNQSGPTQDIGRALIIAMLDDEKLYNASAIAAAYFHARNQKEQYQRLKKGLYSWANQPGKEIANFPDNKHPLTGELTSKGAKWFGKTWKSHLSDMIWNHICGIFEEVRNNSTQDQASGLFCDYWWNTDTNAIEPEHRQQEIAKQSPIPLPSPHETSRIRIKSFGAAWGAVAAAILITLFSIQVNRKPPEQLPSPEAVSSLPEEMSFKDAMIKTRRRQPTTQVIIPTHAWQEHQAQWGGKRPALEDAFVNADPPPLFFNPPIRVASLP